jgi:hypothetical protein
VGETATSPPAEVFSPADVSSVAAPIESVKVAHAALLEEYVGLLALLSRIDGDRP